MLRRYVPQYSVWFPVNPMKPIGSGLSMRRRPRGFMMSSGNKAAPRLSISRLTDFTQLTNFICGVPEMDRFIHAGFEDSVSNHFCVPYSVRIGERMAGFFALNFDAVLLPDDYKDDLKLGATAFGTPGISESYEDTFWSKWHYPAMEISYLAIQAEFQNRQIGRRIVEEIVDLARRQALAGCQFVTVEAYHKPGYSAEGFYRKCRFSRCADPDPAGDTIRMYRFLY